MSVVTWAYCNLDSQKYGCGGGEAQLGRQGLKGDLLAFLIATGLNKTN